MTQRKATKAQAIRAAKKAGVTLTISYDQADLDCGPEFVFFGHYHYQCYYYENEEGYRWGDIWESVISDCEQGLEPAIADCEDCQSRFPSGVWPVEPAKA